MGRVEVTHLSARTKRPQMQPPHPIIQLKVFFLKDKQKINKKHDLENFSLL